MAEVRYPPSGPRLCGTHSRRGYGVLGTSLRPGSLPLLALDLIYTTAVASISTKNSGEAKRVTPSSVLAGRQPAADKRVVIVSQASKHLSTSVV